MFGGLLKGIVMLGFGALLVLALASVFEQRAILRTAANASASENAPPSIATVPGERTGHQWMF